MNRALQPLALAIGLSLLIGLRLIVSYDPVAGVINRWLSNPPAAVEDSSGPQVDALNDRIAQLEAELGFKRASAHQLIPANIISKTSASFRQLIKIDRGRTDDIKPNQAVLSGGYLLGLVTSVEDHSAAVLLLGDPDLNVPVTVGGAEGIASAKAGGLVISQLNDNGLARTGQVVTTSGLGGLYPPGLTLGNLGARLSQDILSEFVLERPFNVAELTLVQVMAGR